MPEYSPYFHEVGIQTREPVINISEERPRFSDSQLVSLVHFLLSDLLLISLGAIHPRTYRGQEAFCMVVVSHAPSILGKYK